VDDPDGRRPHRELLAEKLPDRSRHRDHRVGHARQEPLDEDVAARLPHVHVVFRRDDDRNARQAGREAPVQIRRLQVCVNDCRTKRADDPDESRECKRMAQAGKLVDAKHRHRSGLRFCGERSAFGKTADRMLETRRRQPAGRRDDQALGAADPKGRDDLQDTNRRALMADVTQIHPRIQ